MKLKTALLWIGLIALVWAPRSCPAKSKTVMVYYMPWFTARPYSENWGWHWTMNHFNPDRVNAAAPDFLPAARPAAIPAGRLSQSGIEDKEWP